MWPPRRTFWIGVLSGVVLVLGGRLAINASTLPDRLVAPLLLADSSTRADAIVVLGGGVIGDCVPNLSSMRRTVRAARLFREGRAPMLVVTGGVAGGSCSVADGMRDFARDLGVPDDRIVIEREARSTWENARLTAPLLRARHLCRILIVTDRLHMKRASGVFMRQGFQVELSAVPVYEGHPDNVSMLAAGIREGAALAYYWSRHWMAPAVKGIDRCSPAAAEEFMSESGTRPVVILGASYAAGWAGTTVSGFPVVNKGVAGQRSFEMLERFDQDVVAVRPRAVVLWGFINDIFGAEPDQMPRTLERVRESVTAMVRRAEDAGIEPILATEVTIRAPRTLVDTIMSVVGSALGKRSQQDGVNERVAEVNRWIRELGQREGLLVLDLQRVLADGDGPRRWAYAVDDGSHISPLGYAALADYVAPLLEEHLALKVQVSPRP